MRVGLFWSLLLTEQQVEHSAFWHESVLALEGEYALTIFFQMKDEKKFFSMTLKYSF